MIKRFFELQEKILSYHPDANTELLKKAYSVAADAHINQRRVSDEPYIVHPLEVAATLADMKLDEISISASLLHDVVEDTDYTIEEINRLFGEEVANIVWGVTKISKLPDFDVENAKAETLKKMIIAMTNDVRVILIKLADRLHNLKTLSVFPQQKQQRIARETLEIYAPIAYRLGMGKIKMDLEDIAFPYAFPEEYAQISKELSNQKKWADERLQEMHDALQRLLGELSIPGSITYRMKREISIYRKLVRQNISLHQVYDLLALRITTDSIANCYAILNGIHHNALWQYIPSRLRDFITAPKANGYQSLHTTVITRQGIKFEVQIRTPEMDKIAEEGIAAHWRYKEGISFLENDQRLQWFRDMIEAHRNNPNPKDFLSLVKGELTPNEIYVFTPKGKVINLKAGSSAIDFAFAIHSQVGRHCKSAIVNEQMVPLRTVLNSGDVVEIITDKKSSPTADWLKFTITTRARKKIIAHLQRQENVMAEERGRRLWVKFLRTVKQKHSLKISETELEDRIKKAHFPDLETFYREIGSSKKIFDKLFIKKVFPEIPTPAISKEPVRNPRGDSNYKLVSVEGYSDIDITFARCCAPIKGDQIVGYITQKRGLVIHRHNCAKVADVMSTRLKSVTWVENNTHVFLVRFELIVSDKPGMLSKVTGVTAKHKSNIKTISQERISQNVAKVKMVFDVLNTEQLQKIYNDFVGTKGVLSVIRRKVISE